MQVGSGQSTFMRSGQLMYRRFRCSDRPETADVSLAVRVLDWSGATRVSSADRPLRRTNPLR